MSDANGARQDLLEAAERIWHGLRSGDLGAGTQEFLGSLAVSGYPRAEGDAEEGRPEELLRFFAEGGGLTNLLYTLLGAQVLGDVGVVQAQWIAEQGLGEAGSPAYISGRVALTFRLAEASWVLKGWLGTRGPHEAETAESRPADVQAIREQILRVFEAYRQKDLAMLRRTHTAGWRGFSLRSGSVGKGIDAYMRGAQGALSSMQFQEYRILELDAVFYGDLAVVPYVARIAGKNRLGREEAYRLRVMDVYLREPLGWNQIATNVGLHPEEVSTQG